MTILAWDGKTLAADKRGLNNGLGRTVTKIYRVGEDIVGFAGDMVVGLEMLEWARGGYLPEEMPEVQLDEETTCFFLVINKDGVRVYERGVQPIRFEDKFFACGTGRDYALAAMHLGCDAAKAVEVACVFEASCGNGIDTLELL